MQWWSVSPGSMGVVQRAVSLLGADRVLPGSWASPVHVYATEADAKAFIDLINEIDPKCIFTLKPRK